MKKIDVHCHVTNRPVRDVLVESVTVESVAEKMKVYDIVKTVVLATYFPHKTSGISNYRLLHWIRNKPEFWMFGSLDFEFYFYQGLNELTELAEVRLIKGIKIYTCYQNIDLKSDKFKCVVELALKYSLPMMFHCGHSYSAGRKYGRLTITDVVSASHLEPVADQGVKIIVSHMSKPFFDEVVELVRGYDNVFTDMSGLIDSKFCGGDEIGDCMDEIVKFLTICGPKKLLFGTDHPVQTHEHSIMFIDVAMAGFSDGDKEDVYFNNARYLLL